MKDDILIDLITETIFRCYGYDFRGYAKSSLKRRFNFFLTSSKTASYTEMIPKLIESKSYFESLLEVISVPVTEFFRDPEFFKFIKEKIFPQLSKLEAIKIWHAGCATGEEVYSMAILLHEAGLLSRSTIWATDFYEGVIEKSKKGCYKSSVGEQFNHGGKRVGIEGELNDYFTLSNARYEVKSFIKENINFFEHNLVLDGRFGEMNLILCRNVLIYFASELQEHVTTLLDSSLHVDGSLCLGSRESLNFMPCFDRYDELSGKLHIYQKKRQS